jgi:hypothetical protein
MARSRTAIGAAAGIAAVGGSAISWATGVIDGVLSPKVIDQINAIPEPTITPEPNPTPEPRPGPIVKTPSSEDSCQQTLAEKRWRLLSDRETYIAANHGPNTIFSSEDPKGIFTQSAWANLNPALLDVGLYSPTEPPYVGFNNRCVFTNRNIGSAIGIDDRGKPTAALRVIYNYASPRKGEVWNAFPLDPQRP